MRTAFIETLFDLAAENPNVVLVTADLGFGVVDKFAKTYPRQFLNVGVAEQNMAGIASGLALSGKLVFTYSIANFPTLRCLEQIRNDICYHKANVKIVSVGGGYAYGALGMTHHATEDLAIMSALPGLVVIAPGSPLEVRAATRAISKSPGPCYIRLGRAGERAVDQETFELEIGKANRVREGSDLTLISTGGMLATCVEASDLLRAEGVSTRVLSMHTLKPFDAAAIEDAVKETGGIITVEEHSRIGGLGTTTAATLAHLPRCRFRVLSLPDQFCTTVGDQNFLLAQAGLATKDVVRSAMDMLHSGGAEQRKRGEAM